ncbi:MAG: CoA pyrophosphatase [Candidatus Marinimicrobia bacterium]|nr:CoA pyrophosphatase [Candidatus Neomarinimicrobiota bacterium]
MRKGNTFIQALKSQLMLNLPGKSFQEQMAPVPRYITREMLSRKQNIVQSAVLILLFPDDGKWHFILTERSDRVEYHRRQISLPGGSREEGETLQQTALRETNEEIGVCRDDIVIVGKLSPLFIPVSGFNVHPFVGWAEEKPKINPDPVEVSMIHKITVQDLLEKNNLKQETRIIHNVEVDVPYFDFERGKVWGATAMILGEFREVLRKTEKSLPNRKW